MKLYTHRPNLHRFDRIGIGLKVFAVLVLIIGSNGIAGCSKTQTIDTTTSDTKTVVPVEATKVVEGSIEDAVTFTGHTEALIKEKLTAPIAGKIIQLSGIEGSYVKSGDVLAVIRTKEAQSSIDGAQKLAQQASGTTHQREANQTLQLAEKTANDVQVRSRISGFIGIRSANDGEYVAENQDLFTIFDASSVSFVADIPLNQMGRIHLGSTAEISLPIMNAQTVRAVVSLVKPQADPLSQTAHVVLRFGSLSATQAASLKTDMAGTARIILDTRARTLLVPKAAVLRNDENNTYSLVTFGPDSISRSIDVETGSERDSMVEIRGPEVQAGMNVVTVGNYALPDSSHITLIYPKVESK